jgi:hypothetical protein
MPGIEVNGILSGPSHSTLGAGLPRAEQSTRPPLELVNSNLEGGSLTNTGPWVSYSDPMDTSSPATKNRTSGYKCVDQKPRIFVLF